MTNINFSNYLCGKYLEYSCYILPVTQETSVQTNSIRELHKLRLTRGGYEGFSDQIDDEFHPAGMYFYVEYKGETVQSCRVNDRKQSTRLSFEMGQKKDGSQYKLEDDISSVDISTYSLILRHSKRATPLLTAMLGRYVENIGGERAFCLIDVENKVIQRTHQEVGFVFSKQYSESIFFPTFIYSKSKLPVEWKIMEWDKQVITNYSKLYNDYFDIFPRISHKQ